LSSLPPNFPSQKLSGVNASKLEWFYRRYVEEYYPEYKFGHFLLAAYSAIPALITPDLLYKIWQNFNSYKWNNSPAFIHRIAVSDILLSPICREVGFELYEMDQEIKLCFLEWLKTIEHDNSLWAQRGIYSIEKIAGFIAQYHKVPNAGFIRWGNTYNELQDMEALSYSNPERLAEIFFDKIREQSAMQEETDLLRTMDQFIKTQQRLGIILPENSEKLRDFNDNVKELEAIKNLIQNNSEAFLEKAGNNQSLTKYLSENSTNGIRIEMPVSTRQQLNELIQGALNKPRKKVYACAIGVDHYSLSNDRPLSYCVQNAEKFAAALEEFCEALQRDLLMMPPGSPGNMSRVNMENHISFFDSAEDGDSCIFFYSGMGLMDNQESIRDVVFSDDTVASLNSGSGAIAFRKHLQDLAIKKNIHILLILDIHDVHHVSRTIDPFDFTGSLKGSVIILQNYENDIEWVRDPSVQLIKEDNNHFFNSFFDILSEGGYRLSCSEIMMQLKLRVSRLDVRRPAKYVFPSNMKDILLLLTGEVKRETTYTLSFDESKGWIINAGAKKGIRPSLNFMKTLFGMEDGRQLTVLQVFPDYSVVSDFDGEKNVIYDLSLLQNALPKIKIAFTTTIDGNMKRMLTEAISRYNIYYIELVEEVLQPYYLIDSRENNYALIRRDTKPAEGAIQTPVFGYQSDPFEFIKQIEYIAQWQGVLEFDNTETLLGRDNVWFAFEKIEGQDLANNDKIKAVAIYGGQSVTLNYKLVNNQWYQPAFRCRVTDVTRNLHIAVLYLDATYGITDIGRFEINPAKEEYLPFFVDDSQITTVPVNIAEEYLQNGIEDVTEYIKFFVSDKPMLTRSLEQNALTHGERTITRTLMMGKSNAPLDTTNTDWIAVTIPIRIIRKGTQHSVGETGDSFEFRERVTDIYRERVVSVSEDLQKGRWGGKSQNNNKQLKASVKTTNIIGLYNVDIWIESIDSREMPKGAVAFFVHNQFDDVIEFASFSEGKATIHKSGVYEAFTVGAYTEDETLLEFDLNEQPGYPANFYRAEIPQSFKVKVENLYTSQPVVVKDDLQKKRWGGLSISGGKELTAIVTQDELSGFFKINLRLKPYHKSRPVSGSVAFFLHNTFAHEIVYVKAVNGEANIILTAYEAFTVGAYTADETMLELDLNEIEGYPGKFYYKS